MRITRLAYVMVALLLCWSTVASAATDELRVQSGTAGLGYYRQGVWTVVGATVQNYTDQSQSPLLAQTVGDVRQVQFAREVWLPPRSERRVAVPILPMKIRADARSTDLATQLIVIENGQERSVAQEPSLLPLRRDEASTAVLRDLDDDTAAQAISAIRDTARLQSSASFLSNRNAPVRPLAWQALDSVVVTAEHPDLDLAQLSALRQWLLDGGRLWIALDEVDPQWARLLLGDDWKIVIVDQTEANNLRIEGGRTPFDIKRDYPVKMVRVAAPGAEVLLEAEGYPVALQWAVGRGQVLVTTLGLEAWWIKQEGTERGPLDEIKPFLTERRQQIDVASAGAVTDFAREQIGYTIVSRQPILVVLSVIVGMILLGGLLLSRNQRLEFTAVVSLLAAVGGALVLVALGLMNQSEKPLTVASVEVIRTNLHHPIAHGTGRIDIYAPPATAERVTWEGQGGIAWPSDVQQTTQLVRVVWSGRDNWRFTNFALPHGAVKPFDHHRTIAVDQPLQAQVTLNDATLSGRIVGKPIPVLQDALFATPAGYLPVAIDEEGHFTTRTDQRVPAGQFIDASFMDQTQVGRQAIYRDLLAQPEMIDQPSLLAWTTQFEAGASLSAGATRRAQMLMVIPAVFERPEPGTAVAIPAAMLPMTAYEAAGSEYYPRIFDFRTSEWIKPLNSDVTFLVQFTIPEAMRPLKLDQVTVMSDITMPGWQYEILRYENNRVVPVWATENVSGVQKAELAADQLPTLSVEGNLIVGVRVTRMDPTTQQGWSLNDLKVAIRGTVQPSKP